MERNLEQSSSTELSTCWNVPNSHNLKIQDGGGHHLEFRQNVNNSGLDKDQSINQSINQKNI